MAVSTIGANTTTSTGTTVPTNASANTKGTSWTELVASSAIAADGIIVVPQFATANADFLFDIGTGAAAAETALIANLTGGRVASQSANLGPIFCPIAIPISTRISARSQATTGSSNVIMTAYLIKTDTVEFAECTSCVTYGAATGDSGGTSIDAGAGANTKGSYSQITAATSADLQWLVVGVGNQNNTGRTAGTYLIDIATGASLSESVVIANLLVIVATSAMIYPTFFPPIPIVIPSGTRLAARCQSTVTDATDRLLDIILYGFSGSHSGGGGGAHFSAGFMG